MGNPPTEPNSSLHRSPPAWAQKKGLRDRKPLNRLGSRYCDLLATPTARIVATSGRDRLRVDGEDADRPADEPKNQRDSDKDLAHVTPQMGKTRPSVVIANRPVQARSH